MSESIGRINMDGEKHEMTRDNTSVYRHLGRGALFDHLFVMTSEDSGAYIWSHHPQFEELIKRAAEQQCIMHLNLQEVSETDQESYIRHAMSDVGDSFPEEWAKEGRENE